MKTRKHLITLTFIVLACHCTLFTQAKIKLATRSQFCADFSTIATPDSSTALTLFADDNVLIRSFNNSTGFYLQLIAANDPSQQKLLTNGLTVYIDPTGKRKDRYAIIFPSLMSVRQQNVQSGFMPPRDQQQTQPNQEQEQEEQIRPGNPRHPDLTQQVQQINLKGTLFDIDGDSRAVGIEWVKLTITSNQKICYNIRLPYSVFNLNNILPKQLSIGLLSEFSLPQGMQGAALDDRMGGPGGGMGGPDGGMGGPGGGMGNPSEGMGDPGSRMRPNSSGSKSGYSVTSKPVKGWIQLILEEPH